MKLLQGEIVFKTKTTVVTWGCTKLTSPTHVISKVTDLKKVTADTFYSQISNQYYFNRPIDMLRDIIEFEEVLFTDNGEISPVLGSLVYRVFYKPIFKTPNFVPFGAFYRFQYSQNRGFCP